MAMKFMTASFVVVIVISLLPCLAIWLGVCVIKSAIWSFILYHGLCIAPVIIWARKLWLHDLKLPKPLHFVLLFLNSALFCASTLWLYRHFGAYLLNNENALQVLNSQGYKKDLLLPLCLYFLLVNPLLEEIFWRGVILNKLDSLDLPWKHFGLWWSSAAYAAFHYPIFERVLYQGWAELAILLLTIYGAGLALLYKRTKSLVLISLAHALLTDLAAIALIITLLHNYHM
jgi:membrane protease YdiL (CAAX protease family)